MSGRSSAVEHLLAKQEVEGSSPFARSIFFCTRRGTQVAKGEVCKTSMRRFESDPRLHSTIGVFGTNPLVDMAEQKKL